MHASRLVYADQLKCLAIVLVVLGHVFGQMGLGERSCHSHDKSRLQY